jgi:hypothetical protein
MKNLQSERNKTLRTLKKPDGKYKREMHPPSEAYMQYSSHP